MDYTFNIPYLYRYISVIYTLSFTLIPYLHLVFYFVLTLFLLLNYFHITLLISNIIFRPLLLLPASEKHTALPCNSVASLHCADIIRAIFNFDYRTLNAQGVVQCYYFFKTSRNIFATLLHLCTVHLDTRRSFLFYTLLCATLLHVARN